MRSHRMLAKRVPQAEVPPRTDQVVTPANLDCQYTWEPAEGEECPLSPDGGPHRCSRQTEHRSHGCDCQAVTYRPALNAAFVKAARS